MSKFFEVKKVGGITFFKVGPLGGSFHKVKGYKPLKLTTRLMAGSICINTMITLGLLTAHFMGVV